jgi:mRNA deadenylase 3'-5' endonuclease subunit Ccr4
MERSPEPPTDRSAGAWTIVSWNVLADAYVRSERYPEVEGTLLQPGSRTPLVIAALEATGATLICLQEADEGLMAAARQRLERRGFAVHFASKPGRGEGCALLVGPPFALEEVRTLRFRDGGPDRADSGHLALLATVRLGDRRLGLATTHLRWDPPGTPEGSRWAIRQVTELLGALDPSLPWLLCGDLNVDPGDAVYAALIGAGLTDPAAASPQPTANANGRARRIDHLVHSPGLVAEPLPLPAIDGRTPLPSPTMPSDHLWIGALVRFALPS